MKKWLFVLLLTGIASGLDKPYRDLPISVTSARVDADGVLKIDAKDKNGILNVHLVFTCQVKQSPCAAPLLAPAVYWLTAGSATAVCDEYLIDKGSVPVARVCLKTTEHLK